jgi:hypothetical protein
LCRFSAADDPLRDPNSLGWIWRANEDIWAIWSKATYDVFKPGYMWSDCTDREAAKAAIRRWMASLEP